MIVAYLIVMINYLKQTCLFNYLSFSKEQSKKKTEYLKKNEVKFCFFVLISIIIGKLKLVNRIKGNNQNLIK